MRTQCCASLAAGQCTDCPLTAPQRPSSFVLTSDNLVVSREYVLAQHAEIERLRERNIKLRTAIDLIRETLQGSYVDDLLSIINRALKEPT